MSTAGGRLDKLYPALTAKERALLVLRAWKRDEEEDRRIRLTMPSAQINEFNLYIDLLNGACELTPYVHAIGITIDQMGLRYGWLLTLDLWAIHAFKLADYIWSETKEPITESEYRRRQEAARAEMVPATEFAELLAEEHEGWAVADLKERDDGGEPTVTTAAWKRVRKEKERELAALVGEGVLKGDGKGRRLLINAGSFYGRRGEKAPVWPDWGLEFDIVPDTKAKEVDRRRRSRESAREALMQGPSFAALLRRGSAGNSGGRDGVESKVGRLVAIHEERLHEGASVCWRGLIAAEKVVEEMVEQFSGEDPLKPATRQALQDARVQLDELVEQLKARLGSIELGEPPAELVNKLRRSAGLRSG